MAKSIYQQVFLPAPPDQVYSVLIDADHHSKFTDAPAHIEGVEGGRFSCYGEHLTGINVELIPAKRIVQAWRGDEWAEGEWSIVIFHLETKDDGTNLRLEQHGVPDAHYQSIDNGWKKYYWEKLTQYLEQI
ncbi:MAG: hypothetical protein D6748_11945 [Calditrichaeota bacterium]|nr:MAG: hypothetical protein D6748_11945 [Calditrichota bacterium]